MAKANILLLVLTLTLGRVAADTISVPVPTCASVTSVQPGRQRICAPEYASVSSPGDPALPFKDIHVIIPPNADPKSVSVRLSGGRTQNTPVREEIAPAPPIATSVGGREIREWGRGKIIRNNRNVLVYERPTFYPTSNVKLATVGYLRKWQIATVRYYPYRYNPVSRTLEELTAGNIVLSYRTSARQVALSPTSLTDLRFYEQIDDLTVNYKQAQRWYSSDTAKSPSDFSEPQTITDYVIITTSAIVAGSTKLQAFVNHKTARGFSLSVITESEWGGGTGDTAATNIRSYLQGHYIASGIRYVLLIGNPDPASGDVPMKMLWPRYTSSTYRQAPSDYFYADLTGDWDLNGNGYYGEEIVDFGPGGIDRFAEVIVGRIPFYGDYSALDSILQKTINYESGTSPEGWVRNVLLSMKPSDSSTPGYQLGEAIKANVVTPSTMNAIRSYDTDYGLNPVPEHIPCNYSGVLSAWQQHAGFHFWWTHGSETRAQDIFSAASCESLDDNYPSFTFQCSCLNAAPENSDNLAYSLLKHGAIATDAATRVSWYYVGETTFTASDSNAGMTYSYAKKLISEHLPCGDAHYAMMIDVPNDIWMNHCVFNLYGDPSVRYPMAPIISHTPLQDTDATTQPYPIEADITATSPLASGYPLLLWNTDGGSTFSEIQMIQGLGPSYLASIPAQPYDTTVYYYIKALDVTDLSSTYPTYVPQSLLSFRVIQDTAPPTIVHTPMANTADKFGPYIVDAIVTDDIGVANVSLFYSRNGTAYSHLDMTLQSGDLYEADIPGPAQSGDTISYYITATDSSLNANVSRLPAEPGAYSFDIGNKIYVAVLNSTATPSYLVGGNINAWQNVCDILNDDPAHRFQVSVVTSLIPSPGTLGLEGQDVLVLPDNGVPIASQQTVSDWFQPGKVIITFDTSTCYAAYTGWMWSAAAGTNGYGTYWDYTAEKDDQEIWAQDPITSEYAVGQIIGSMFGDAVFKVDKLPPDAHVLTGRANNHTRAYAAYRDVPGKGRLVMLGPYIRPVESQYSIIREAAIGPAQARQISIDTPNGGESFGAGDLVSITFTCSGVWQDSDKIALEYSNDFESSWLPVPGAQSLDYGVRSFQWNTVGLPGSHTYRVRAVLIGDSLSDQSDEPFTILPTLDIVAAKSTDNGELIKLAGKVVTCGTGGMAYVEEPNRSAGLRIEYEYNLASSALVDIVGTMGSANGERVLNAESVEIVGAGVQIKPFAIKAAALGGSSFGLQDAVMEYRMVEESGIWALRMLSAHGLNNIGLLVRLCGRVTAIGDSFFYLDDGSGCSDGSMYAGVRVICPEGLVIDLDQRVIIDAVSSTYFDGTTTWRAAVLPGKYSLKLQ